MGFWGKEFHPEYMPTSQRQCGWCDNLDTHDSKGTKYWCSKTRSYCTLKESCRKFEDARDRTRSELKELCTWHLSTMIGLILGENLSEKPFSSIKILKDVLSQEEDKQRFIELYDVYGELIATGLYFDLQREEVASFCMPILNKVSFLVDNKNYEEAFTSYYEMVMMLYKKYSHTLSKSDYLKNDSNKILVKSK